MTTIPGLDNPGATAQVVTITPETAAQWLALNTRNRLLSEATVKQYADDMTAGRWEFNGQPVIFAADGTLLDGQHRLTAQSRAGVPCTWLVVTGLPPRTQNVMDIGRTRTVAGQFQIEGRRFTTAVAAVARLLLVLTGERTPSKTKVREYALAAYEDLAAAATRGQAINSALGGSVAAYAAAAYTLTALDEDAGDDFLTSLTTGADLPEGSPILALRNTLIRWENHPQDTSRAAIVWTIFRAWNHWRDGKHVQMVRVATKAVQPR